MKITEILTLIKTIHKPFCDVRYGVGYYDEFKKELFEILTSDDIMEDFNDDILQHLVLSYIDPTVKHPSIKLTIFVVPNVNGLQIVNLISKVVNKNEVLPHIVNRKEIGILFFNNDTDLLKFKAHLYLSFGDAYKLIWKDDRQEVEVLV